MAKSYTVIDYYESPFGESIFITEDKSEAEKFCREFEEDTDGECCLKIRESK